MRVAPWLLQRKMIASGVPKPYQQFDTPSPIAHIWNRDDKHAARSKDAEDLAGHPLWLEQVLEHLGADNKIERAIGEGARRRVVDNSCIQAECAGLLHSSGGDVNSYIAAGMLM